MEIFVAKKVPSALLLIATILGVSQAQWRPCVELKRDLHVPCRCTPDPGNSRALRMNCDRVVFTRDTVETLRDQPVTSLSQRNCGYQRLPEELLNSAPALRALDLSGNSITRLMDRLLRAQPRLRVLRLGENLLGDSLNPIFSSNEFRDMAELRLLDLRANGLRSIEEGIFKGCESLEDLYLDDNNLTVVPADSLKGPRAMRLLSLAGNNIGSLPRGAFSTLGESLMQIDLSRNELAHMEDGALAGLSHVVFLNLSRNDLTRFNSDVFKGAYNLLQLDLSANFLHEFPSDALRHLEALKLLVVSDNLITEIERSHLTGLTELEVLDLSRNNIGRLGVNTFANLTALTRLDLSMNALRTIEESSFEGLVNLEWLSLQDNNILLVPALAVSRLPSLTHLHVEYNRIAALSSDLLRSTASSLSILGLTRNLVREIPARLFQNFENLVSIELSGNMLSTVSQHTFAGLEETLLALDLSDNRLTSVAALPLRSLQRLNLADNHLKRLSPETFEQLRELRQLNISGNPLYGGFPPIFPSSLTALDASRTGLKVLPTVLLLNLRSLASVRLSGNHLQEIGEGTFQHLRNLTHVDLSHNAIERIDNGAFVGLANLHSLDLRGNRLASFAGEHFNTGTGLAVLDLSDNEIAHLSPTSFLIHPRLRDIRMARNRLARFPTEYFRSLQFLERVDLSGNAMRSVAEFAFSQLGHLRELDLSGNRIESVDELAFHNSTQLQILDLSGNVLETLSERTMEGVLRLESLDLSDNRLSSLPETIFDPSRVRSVEKINLAGNRFNEIPVRALQRQSARLRSLSVARNRLSELFTQDIVNAVKELDLSENPLSEAAVRGILGEAKILRSLNLARTGVKSLTRLETPFLKHLNLSGNEIGDVRPAALERATLLETLDLSSNRLDDFGGLVNTFKTLPALRVLDVSGNAARNLNESSFEGLDRLRVLRISNLANCTRIEKSAFKNLGRLRALSAQNYPRLGYFDVQGILRDMTSLECLDVEIKDSTVGNELLSVRTHPRLRSLTLRGERLRSILSSALVGVRTSRLYLGLKNSSIDAIPASLFFPVPRSTRVELDVAGSNFTTIPAQLIAALDERSGMVRLTGLTENPISCDCEVKHLWRWLKMNANGQGTRVVCRTPDHFAGQILTDISEELLSCDRATSTRLQTTQTSRTTLTLSTSTTRLPTASEPEIIWTAAPTSADERDKIHPGDAGGSPVASSGTDDTLIIGIVGGVVTVILVVIIVICICRLRWSNQVNEARMAAMASSIHEASVIRPGSAYSGKMNHEAYVGSFNGSTMGHPGNVHGASMPNTPVQMMPYMQPMHMVHPAMHAAASQAANQPIYGYYDNGNPPLPMYMSAADSNKFER